MVGTLDIEEFDGQNGKVRKPVVTVNFVEPSPGQNNNDGYQDSPRQYQKPKSNDTYQGPESFDDDIPF